MVAGGISGAAFAQSTGPSQEREQVLHVFRSGDQFGGPTEGMVKDAAGNYYGTLEFGGPLGIGTVFQLSPNPDGGWTYKTIYRLTGDQDGSFPQSRLAIDSAGNLYGSSSIGSTNSYNGAIWEISPSNGKWVLSRSHPLALDNHEGVNPVWGVIVDAAGNVYGTANVGGSVGAGTAFKLQPSGDTWQYQLLHDFQAQADGENPAALTLAPNGDLYGTTQGGGAPRAGNVFKLSNASGAWTFSNAYEFPWATEVGMNPRGRLVFDPAGNLYGFTSYGGVGGYGTLFKLLKPADGSGSTPWTLSLLYSFGGSSDGTGSGGVMTLDDAGNIYATSYYGGASNSAPGLVYKMTKSATVPWTQTILYTFTGGRDGRNPAGIMLDGNFLYGTTEYGGRTENPQGVAFRVLKDGLR